MIVFYIKDCWVTNFSISLLMIGAVMLLAKCMGRKKCSIVSQIGENAFTVYLYSWPIQAVTELLMTVVLKSNWLVTWIFMFIAGICGPMIMIQIYKKLMPRNRILAVILGVKI